MVANPILLSFAIFQKLILNPLINKSLLSQLLIDAKHNKVSIFFLTNTRVLRKKYAATILCSNKMTFTKIFLDLISSIIFENSGVITISKLVGPVNFIKSTSK